MMNITKIELDYNTVAELQTSPTIAGDGLIYFTEDGIDYAENFSFRYDLTDGTVICYYYYPEFEEYTEVIEAAVKEELKANYLES